MFFRAKEYGMEGEIEGAPAAEERPMRWVPGRVVAGVARRGLSRFVAGGIAPAFLATMLAMLAALGVMGHVDGANLQWPVSGVALAMCLPQWHRGGRTRVWVLLASGGGFWTAAMLLGMPWKLATLIAALTCLDVYIGASLLSPDVKSFEDLKDQRKILRFLLFAIAAPMLSALIVVYPVARYLKQPVPQTLLMCVLGNSLGIAMSVPTILLIRSGDWLGLRKNGQKPLRIVGASLLFIGVSGFVFWQTANPFLFMVFPPMILLNLTMGLEGSVLASLVLTNIGWLGTMHGHGPVLLARGSDLHHLLVLQGYIWICLATSLPVGALLDEWRRAEHSAKEAQSIYQVLLEHTEDFIVLSTMEGQRRYASPAITRLAGWTQEEYLEIDRLETFHPDDREIGEEVLRALRRKGEEQTIQYRLKEKSGGCRWVQAKVRAYGVTGAAVAGYVMTIRDISELKRTEEMWKKERLGLVTEQRKMASLANTDPLTGLLNRRGFDEMIDVLKRQAAAPVAMLMVDLDYFKHYNDTYGHLKGDDVLVQIAGILRTHATRKHDFVARLGGEEFAVVLAGAGSDEAQEVAEAICEVLRSAAIEHTSSPFVKVTMSVGVAAATGAGELDIRQLIARADSALYVSKRSRNRVTGYSKETGLKTA